ncbi:hypothetical protein TorRG33x02_353370, partial [Trema orientale]
TVKEFCGHLDSSFVASSWHPNGSHFSCWKPGQNLMIRDIRNLSKSVAVLRAAL